MLIEWISAVNGQVPDNLDWDMVTMPEFKDRPGVHSKIDFHAAYVSTMAKEKATAAEVIAFLATSETVQRRMAENAKVPVIDRPDILQQYGTGKMKGKHIEVLQKTVMAPIPPFSAYENQWPFTGAPLINLAYNPVMQGQKDVNTGLRDADEAIKNLFKAEKAK
jgi:multiple sugar transport system substrate-binding protein